MKVYLVTAHETEGYCGPGVNFNPEIYSIQERAIKRFSQLQSRRKPYSGIFFTIEEVEVDSENEDF
jgi:hypothetical protein